MSIEIIENHRCDACSNIIKRAEPDTCLCNEHLEKKITDAYNEGVQDTKREYNITD